MKSKNILTLMLLGNLVSLSGCIINEETKDLAESTARKGGNIGQNIMTDFKNVSLNDSQKHQIKVNIAVNISNQVKQMNLRPIDLKKVQTYQDYVEMVDHLNLAIQIINDKIDSDFMYLQKGTESYDKFMMEVSRYSPLIDNYNEFIQSSYDLVPSDECSVNNLYIKGMKFGGEATLVLGGAFYGTAFEVTGTLARTFGLTKMTSICSPCVSAAMSSLHWATRNSLIEETTETIGRALSGDCANQTSIS